MQEKSDAQLLREYAEHANEAAFREIVNRHAGLVYSSALRQVTSPDLARDVAQSVFTDLARKASALAGTLTESSSLLGWLYRSTRFTALNQLRDDRRRLAREKQVMQHFDPASETAPEWDHVQPVLDEAMADLSDEDRDALLLRFFKNHDFRAIGEMLGVSDDTAQKRVSRALERLRTHLTSRGVTTTAVALSTALSTNAAPLAPAGLAAALSAGALSGASLATTATAIKAIAMTTLQKTLITATVVVLTGTGIYEARQAAQLREENQRLQQQQAPLTELIQQLNQALANATNRVAGLSDELVSAKSNNTELLKLRGAIGVLRAQLAEVKTVKPPSKKPPLASARAYYDRAGTHYMNHDYEAQLEDLDKAIELDPNLAEAYFMRGNLYASNLPKQRGGYEKAIADYTRCLEIKPNDAGARWNRAMHYPDMRRADEAIADWTTYLESDTDFSLQGEGKTKSLAGAYFYRGRVYHWQKKDYSQAISDYTAALALDPQREGAHRLRGQVYESIGELEKAQQDFAIEPKN